MLPKFYSASLRDVNEVALRGLAVTYYNWERDQRKGGLRLFSAVRIYTVLSSYVLRNWGKKANRIWAPQVSWQVV